MAEVSTATASGHYAVSPNQPLYRIARLPDQKPIGILREPSLHSFELLGQRLCLLSRKRALTYRAELLSSPLKLQNAPDVPPSALLLPDCPVTNLPIRHDASACRWIQVAECL